MSQIVAPPSRPPAAFETCPTVTKSPPQVERHESARRPRQPTVALLVSAFLLLGIFGLPLPALGHTMEGDIVITPDGYTAPDGWSCSTLTNDLGTYVYCRLPDHPQNTSPPAYVCTRVAVEVTGTPFVHVYGGSWCTSMAVGATCTTDAVTTHCTDEYGTWGQTHGSQVGCRALAEVTVDLGESWNVRCSSLVQHIEDVPHVDLAVQSIGTEPAQPVVGEPMLVTSTVANLGNMDSGPFPVRLVFGSYYADVPLENLAPGESVEVSHEWVPTVAGWYLIRATSDPDNAVRESIDCSTEGSGTVCNNRRSSQVEVTDAPPPPPVVGVDLSPEAQSATVPARGTATYTITVTNTGNQDDVVTLSANGAKQGWTVTLSQSSVALGPGASAHIELTVNAGNAGTLTVTVTGASQADPGIRDSSTCQTRVGK